MNRPATAAGLAAFGLVVLVGVRAGDQATEARPAYPEGYRSWTHVKSMVIREGHPLESPFLGIHHVYANPQAVEGLRSGHYPDGAVLAFDLLESVAGDKTLEEGGRRLLGVMEKNRTAYPQSAGWGYEAFDGDSRSERLVTDGGAACHACHTAMHDRDYVFSRLRE